MKVHGDLQPKAVVFGYLTHEVLGHQAKGCISAVFSARKEHPRPLNPEHRSVDTKSLQQQ